MKRIISLSSLFAVIGVASALVLVGCADSSSTAAPTQTVDAGCAMCTYKMEGAKSCAVAIKVDGKAYLVEGGDVDSHALCEGEKKAEVSGKVEGDKFVATSITLK